MLPVPENHRPDTTVRKELEEKAVVPVAIENVGVGDPHHERLDAPLEFRDHPADDRPVLDEMCCFGEMNALVRPCPGLVHYPVHIGEVDELVRLERNRYLCRSGVGIDIQRMPAVVDGNRGTDREVQPL